MEHLPCIGTALGMVEGIGKHKMKDTWSCTRAVMTQKPECKRR